MYLYGAGGHSKVVLDILQSLGQRVEAVFDDEPATAKLQGVAVRNGLRAAGPEAFRALDAPLILCVGDNARRAALARLLSVEYGQAIHGSAIISQQASVGCGTVVLHGAVIQTAAQLGKHVIINALACVAHDVQIEDFVHVCPHATLCGHVEVGEGTLVGSGAVVIPCVRIGRWCTIGAGAVVVRDVPDYSTVVGNPARALESNSPGTGKDARVSAE